MIKYLKYFVLCLCLVIKLSINIHAQNPDSLLIGYDIGEIVVFDEYRFANAKEEAKYRLLEEDLRIIYPLITIIRSEYARINKELSMYYEGDREKEFLKWYENYARESYMHHLSVLNVRQGKLFLKMVTRELDYSPYDLIVKYRNGFRAVIWQGAARMFFANLKTEYKKEDNPMIEHIMKKLDAEYACCI